MSCFRRLLTVAAAFIVGGLNLLPPAAAFDLPEFAEVEAAVSNGLAREKDLGPSDVVSRSQVRKLLDAVERLGWTLDDRREIESRVLDDGAFLIAKFRTPGGKKFMRKIASLPLAYDRIDRLAQLPQGRSTVERLIKGPDGHKLLQYMAEEQGGRELAKMLSQDGRGNFNKPTGKLYTAEQLLAELKSLHVQAVSGRRSPSL
jgi:hypothetical protein